MRKSRVVCVLVCLGVFLMGSWAAEPGRLSDAAQKSHTVDIAAPGFQPSIPRMEADYGKIPLQFIPNAGQVDGRVSYYYGER